MIVQVILKASAGMDYWEFAQFIVTLALPRLHCLEKMGALPEGDNAWTTLKQFIHRVSSKDSQRAVTFFKSGSFPCNLNCRPLSDASVMSSLDLQTNLKEFKAVFSPEVNQLVEQVSRDSSSSVVYRVFEVYMLSSAAKELNKALDML